MSAEHGYSDGMAITPVNQKVPLSGDAGTGSVPTYSFGKKDKLPKGLAYPLKRSVLDAELSKTTLSKLQCVYYSREMKGSGIVLRANHCGEGRRGWAGAGLASIWIFAVPAHDKRTVEQAVISEMLPEALKWLANLECAGNTRRGVDQDFSAVWSNGEVTFHKST